MTAKKIVRPGFYLLDNPPARSQGRTPRRAPVRPVAVLHTTESGTHILERPDPKAENVAAYIRRRATPGNYHIIGDSDSIIPMLPFDWETWGDGTGSNRWAIHLALAMNAADWPTINRTRGSALLDSMVQMAVMASRWLTTTGLEPIGPRRLTKAQSDQPSASGFIAHGDRDPGRRFDPGASFPWDTFLDRYQTVLSADLGTTTTTLPQLKDTMNTYVAQLQERLGDLKVDGDYGPKTHARVNQFLDSALEIRQASSQLRASHEQLGRQFDQISNERDALASQVAELTQRLEVKTTADPTVIRKADLWDAHTRNTRERHQLDREAQGVVG